MKLRHFSVSLVTLTSIVLAIAAWLLSFAINALPADLTTKVGLTMVFVTAAYVFMIYNCLRMKGATNLLFIMLCLSIPFYYGQHIVAMFDPKYLLNSQTYSILDGKLPDECIINASFLIIACMLLLSGAFLAHKDSRKQQKEREAVVVKPSLERKLSALRITAVVFLLISAVPTVRYLLAQYALTQTYGYLGRRNLEVESNYFQILGVSYFVVTLSQFFLPALYALLMYVKKRAGKIIVYALMIAYFILYYMTGSRFNLLKMLVTAFLIRVIWIKPLSKKELKKYVWAGVVFVVLFSVGTILRNIGGGTIKLDQVLDELTPSGTLWESGITFTTVSNLMDKCPSVVPFFYGKSWLGSVLQCLPERLRFGFFEKYSLQTSSTFSRLYYDTTMFGYGSSFIAEGYYNFGFFVLPIMLLFGGFLSWMNNRLQLAKKTSSPYLFLVLVYVCGELAYGIRNDLSSILRLTLTTVVIIIFVAFVIETVMKRIQLQYTKRNAA